MIKNQVNQENPAKIGLNKAKTEAIASVRTRWLAWRDSLRIVTWEELFPHPTASLQQINQLLAIAH